MHVGLIGSSRTNVISQIRDELVSRAQGSVDVVDLTGELGDRASVDALVLIVPPVLPHDDVQRVRSLIQTVSHDDLPTIGVLLSRDPQPAADVCELPHDDDWLVLDSADGNTGPAVNGLVDQLLTALQHLERKTASALRIQATKVIRGVKSWSKDGLKSAREHWTDEGRPAEKNSERLPRCSVFVSYSTQDKKAKDIVAELQRLGFTVWFDKLNIKGGEDWRVSIERGIRAADVFVLLLSPNVSREPTYIRMELNAAQSAGKKLIPVRLRPTDSMPDGFEIILSAYQRIDLFPDFSAGMAELSEALGAQDVRPSTALGARLRRRRDQLQAFSYDKDLAGKGKAVASGLAVGAAAVGAVAIKVMSEQQQSAAQTLADQREAAARALAEQADLRDRERARALTTYAIQTIRVLRGAMEEVELSIGMTTEDYRRDFRPTFSALIGELKGNRPPVDALRTQHDQMVEQLRQLMSGLDAATEKADKGDEVGYQRAIKKGNLAWSRVVTSSLDWLSVIAGTEDGPR